MKSRWSDSGAAESVVRWGAAWGDALALRTYASRLIGIEPDLVLHGGGNTSVKGTAVRVTGEEIPAIWVKASGFDLARIEPAGHAGLDLGRLAALMSLPAGGRLDDALLENELRTRLLRADAPTPSLETLAHAFLPPRFLDHTHAAAILALTNRPDGASVVAEALGEDVAVLPYIEPGLDLALAAAAAFEARPGLRAMVWSHHGLLTWGETARESYEATIDLVTRAEAWIEAHGARAEFSGARPGSGDARAEFDATAPGAGPGDREDRAVRAAYEQIAPVIRGALVRASGGRRWILEPLLDRRTRDTLAAGGARALALAPPLTTDHLIRTRVKPLWLEGLDDEDGYRDVIDEALAGYAREYEEYAARNSTREAGRPEKPPTASEVDPLPRVICAPGLGAVACGENPRAARIAADIALQTLRVKEAVASSGRYAGLDEASLHAMEFRPMQQAKRRASGAAALEGRRILEGRIALVTGAAGAIGAGICRELARAGACVAATDLPGKSLEALGAELEAEFPGLVAALPMDVTSAEAVTAVFGTVAGRWGGLDLVIANAGIAHVEALVDLDLESFRRLERVNTEGTLLVLAEAGRRLAAQGCGGDIVLVSTKNVPSPGARFGAYSATKAAAHQLARIASLEFAPMDVRVNMVAPDAVFGEGDRRSGLWAEVGPERMKARGLDAAGLEDYYRDRNLLKVRVTPEDVARAVLFFATRQTPTTGATIPVDGGLPDATPR